THECSCPLRKRGSQSRVRRIGRRRTLPAYPLPVQSRCDGGGKGAGGTRRKGSHESRTRQCLRRREYLSPGGSGLRESVGERNISKKRGECRVAELRV